jgi:hypothetical protein
LQFTLRFGLQMDFMGLKAHRANQMQSLKLQTQLKLTIHQITKELQWSLLQKVMLPG